MSYSAARAALKIHTRETMRVIAVAIANTISRSAARGTVVVAPVLERLHAAAHVVRHAEEEQVRRQHHRDATDEHAAIGRR